MHIEHKDLIRMYRNDLKKTYFLITEFRNKILVMFYVYILNLLMIIIS